MNKKDNATFQNATFYLGSKEDRLRRIKALDETVEKLGIPNRSVLLQMIADGELRVIPAPADDLRTA